MWRLIEVLVAMSWRSASPSGPNLLYQDRSIRCEAIFCPVPSRFTELSRWVRELKYPNEEDKFKGLLCFGCISMCVTLESSKARAMPRIVTRIAAVFVSVRMVTGGVFVGKM